MARNLPARTSRSASLSRIPFFSQASRRLTRIRYLASQAICGCTTSTSATSMVVRWWNLCRRAAFPTAPSDSSTAYVESSSRRQMAPTRLSPATWRSGGTSMCATSRSPAGHARCPRRTQLPPEPSPTSSTTTSGTRPTKHIAFCSIPPTIRFRFGSTTTSAKGTQKL